VNEIEWQKFRDGFSRERGAIHDDRNHRYAHDNDVLANFRRNARGRLTPLEVWRVYAGKHWDAICSLVDDLSHGKTVSPAKGENSLLSSFHDLANYIEFGAALVSEDANPAVDEPEYVTPRYELPLILVDLDDTLWDFVGECSTLVEGGIPDEYLYQWGGIYKYLGPRTEEVMNEAADRMNFSRPFDYASEALNLLFDDYRIGIVTSRHSGTLNRIRAWLADNLIPSDFILTGQNNKGEVARGMDALCLIDDSIENLEDCIAREGGAACLAKKWNIDAEDNPDIKRFDSWKQIYSWLSVGKELPENA